MAQNQGCRAKRIEQSRELNHQHSFGFRQGDQIQA